MRKGDGRWEGDGIPKAAGNGRQVVFTKAALGAGVAPASLHAAQFKKLEACRLLLPRGLAAIPEHALVADRDPSTHGLYEMIRYHLALDGSGASAGKRMRPLLGLLAYGTYDLTNQATLRGWSSLITAIDMAWGATLTAVVAAVAVIVARRLGS